MYVEYINIIRVGAATVGWDSTKVCVTLNVRLDKNYCHFSAYMMLIAFCRAGPRTKQLKLQRLRAGCDLF